MYRCVGAGLLFTRQHNIGGIWEEANEGWIYRVQFETMAFSRLTRLLVFKPVTNNNGDTANEEIIPSVLLADPRNSVRILHLRVLRLLETQTFFLSERERKRGGGERKGGRELNGEF